MKMMSLSTSIVNLQFFPFPSTRQVLPPIFASSSLSPSYGLGSSSSIDSASSCLDLYLITSCPHVHGSATRGWRCFSDTSGGKNSIQSEPASALDSKPKPKRRGRPKKVVDPPKEETVQPTTVPKEESVWPTTVPKEPSRGPRSEREALEDYVRDKLVKTLAAIREKNPSIPENKKIFKERIRDDESDTVDSGGGDNKNEDEDDKVPKMVVEEDDPHWPLDADVGWGIRASEYFEKHPIRNVVGEDGVEIDWEGETDDAWVKEINCLEWETFAFHPTPLMILVFERYNRATLNWKLLKEMEKALYVYWRAKDRLPPRAVKLDINIERDLAYALQVRECPQLLFLRGQKILYREKEFRSADDLVKMIAFFYYKAKKPSWIEDAALYR